jgi:hypothetical protein
MTLAIDFDKVIHGYSLGWHDGTIYDPPVPGAVQGVQCLMQYDACFVHTTRRAEQVVPWLEGIGLPATDDDHCPTCNKLGHGGHPDCPACEGTGLLLFWVKRGELLVTNRKLPATAYLDDRAVTFTAWDKALADLGMIMGRQLRPDADPL